MNFKSNNIANVTAVKNLLTGWRIVVFVICLAIFSGISGQRFDGEHCVGALHVGCLAPIFALRSFQNWGPIALGGIMAFTVANIAVISAPFNDYSFNTDLGSDLATNLTTIAWVSFFDLLCAAVIALIVKFAQPPKYDADGFFVDVSERRVHIPRIALSTIILLLAIWCIALAQTQWAPATIASNISALSMAIAITVGCIVVLPVAVGTALLLGGAPWLEPALRPKQLFFGAFFLALIAVNVVLHMTPLGQSSLAI